MAGRDRHHTDWTARGHFERAAAADRLRGERAGALIAVAQARIAAAKPRPLLRPGVSAPTALRYATTSEPQRWSLASAGRVIITAIEDSAQDGADRVVFAWPSRPGGAFVAAAMALQQARASGTLAYATFGFWPWRNGATWAARSILVNPADLLAAAQRICTEVRGNAAWADKSLAHEDRAVVELRLRELLKENKPYGPGDGDGKPIVVRSPNLLETTTVFPPREISREPYAADADQVLYRVRRHTRIGELNLGGRLTAVGDPSRTPFALLGLPPVAKPEGLHHFLRHARVEQSGPRCGQRRGPHPARSAVAPVRLGKAVRRPGYRTQRHPRKTTAASGGGRGRSYVRRRHTGAARPLQHAVAEAVISA